VLGAKNCILVKDVTGLYAEDPRIHPDAELIPEITAEELLQMDLEDLVLERAAVELLQFAVNVKAIRIVDGLVSGNVTKALEGHNVGTVIHAKPLGDYKSIKP
jgi:molybdenum storage protein